MGRVNNTILMLTTALLPFVILPVYIHNIFEMPKYFFIMLCGTVLLILNFDQLKKMPKIVLLLIVFCFINLLYTKNPYYTKHQVLLIISCLLVYYIASKSINSKIFYIIVLAGLLECIFVFLQFFNIYILNQLKGITDIIGTIGNANFLGAYLCFPLLISFGLMFYKKKFVPVFLILCCAMFIVRARASWIACFAGMIIILLLIRPSINRKNILISSAVLLFMVMIVSNMTLYFGYRVSWSKCFDPTTLYYRLKNYAPPAIKLIKDSPLMGHGIGSYRNLVYDAQVAIERITGDYFSHNPDPKPRRVHNDYLEMLVSGGMIYLGLWMVFIGGVLVRGFKRIMSMEKGSYEYIVHSTAIGTICAVLVLSLFFFPFNVEISLFSTCLNLGVIDCDL